MTIEEQVEEYAKTVKVQAKIIERCVLKFAKFWEVARANYDEGKTHEE